MSSFNLAKKLTPAKKAWMSFTKKLQSELHKLNISVSIEKTTRGLIPLCSIRHLLISRSLTRHHSLSPRGCCLHHSHLDYIHKNVAAIYVDELCAGVVNNPISHAKKLYQYEDEGKSLSTKEMGGTSTSGRGETKAEGRTVFSLSQGQGIDERAEEFILKFREDLKLQREKSIRDFQEMLARSC
ncbi:hypothetical protein Vadar_005211 [Vaccinium darrowii]|uniref:Uncharacterized protein n=1 Tax=Vaccinium darrowii TaxID=229202 RepID=A0ACB7XNE0_9ERIC|nr:hypothetical protein Vadar_005211 [Vaccinium darrowii]